MKKIIGVLLVSLFFSLSFLFAQESVSAKWPNNQVGFTASMFTGYGLVYGYHWTDEFMTKLNLYGYGQLNSTLPQDRNFKSTLGLTFQYDIMKARYTKFGIFASISHWYEEWYEYTYNYPSNNNQGESIDRAFIVGLGFNLDFLAWSRIGFSFQGGYLSGFWSKNGFKYEYILDKGTYVPFIDHPIIMEFGAGVSVTYNF